MTSPYAYPAWHQARATVATGHLKALIAVAVMIAAGQPVAAQENWNPFADATGFPTAEPPRRRAPQPPVTAPPGAYLPPMSGTPGPLREGTRGFGEPPPTAGGGSGPPGAQPPAFGTAGPREKLESADLAPLPGLPQPISRPNGGTGFDTKAMAELLAGLSIPSRSPTLTKMLRSLFAAPDSILSGGSAEHVAMRAEVLYRAGLVRPAADVVAGVDPTVMQSPVMQVLASRVALADGDRERACNSVRAAAAARKEIPDRLAAEVLIMQGYCAAANGNAAGAGLAANLAREQGAASPETLALLDAVAVGDAPSLEKIKRLNTVQWRLAEAGKQAPRSVPVDGAEPAAIAAIAASKSADPVSRLHAAEAAARLNAIPPEKLADVYRQQSIPEQGSRDRGDAAIKRALLFRAAAEERTPFKKTRHVRSALDDARRNGLYLQMAAALAPVVAEIRPVPEIGWFTETGIEVMLAAGRIEDARAWVSFANRDAGRTGPAGSPLEHWLALIDIADADQRTRRGESLSSIEELALRGRLTPDALHRLATVLDALDYQVPFRLWEASSRAPQPTQGFLPPTGVLHELNQAAKARDQVRTILLVIRTLGPDATDGAQIIAIGDSIRALKRVGLMAEARRLGFEALFALWPRAANS